VEVDAEGAEGVGGAEEGAEAEGVDAVVTIRGCTRARGVLRVAEASNLQRFRRR